MADSGVRSSWVTVCMRFRRRRISSRFSSLVLSSSPISLSRVLVQPDVQRPVARAQAVGVGIHFRRTLPLHGHQAVAEGVQFAGRGQYLYRPLAAQCAGKSAFLPPDGADARGPPRHLGQVVHQQAVRRLLPLHRLHDVQQVDFLVGQQGAEGVNLPGADVSRAVGFQRLQQAVRAQTQGVVAGAVSRLPSDDALAQRGEAGHVAVGGLDAFAQGVDFLCFCFNLTCPFPFMQ